MSELKLKQSHLDEIFEFDFDKSEISLNPYSDGTLRSSINMQQFYNWYRKKQVDFQWAPNMVSQGGFWGLQPVIKFKPGLKLIVPNVSNFTIHGMITTELPGEYPFLVHPETVITMSQYSRPHSHIFLSHSSKDKPFVRELRKMLYSICDTFFDETDIKPGQSITTRLNVELERTDLLTLIFSSHALASEWVQREWTSILYMGKPIVVVKLDDTELPPLLKDLKYVDGRKSLDITIDGISSALGGT